MHALGLISWISWRNPVSVDQVAQLGDHYVYLTARRRIGDEAEAVMQLLPWLNPLLAHYDRYHL